MFLRFFPHSFARGTVLTAGVTFAWPGEDRLRCRRGGGSDVGSGPSFLSRDTRTMLCSHPFPALFCPCFSSLWPCFPGPPAKAEGEAGASLPGWARQTGRGRQVPAGLALPQPQGDSQDDVVGCAGCLPHPDLNHGVTELLSWVPPAARSPAGGLPGWQSPLASGKSCHCCLLWKELKQT